MLKLERNSEGERTKIRLIGRARSGGPMTAAQGAVVLNENVVMHTPVLIKPIVGRELVSFAVSISTQSRDDPGKYVFEGKIDARTTFLRWQGTVEGQRDREPGAPDRRRERTAAGAHNRIQAVSGPQDIQRSADRSERRQGA